jgi:transposase
VDLQSGRTTHKIINDKKSRGGSCTAPQKLDTNQLEEVQFFMVKITEMERLAAVLEVEDGEMISTVAKKYQISPQVINRSIGLYREHGETGLSSRGRKYSVEERFQIIEYMHKNHLSYKDTGIQFGISGSNTVWDWEHKYLENGINGLENKKNSKKPRLQKPKPPKTREEELLDRIQYLEAENEYLKKMNALVAERENLERESK